MNPHNTSVVERHIAASLSRYRWRSCVELTIPPLLATPGEEHNQNADARQVTGMLFDAVACNYHFAEFAKRIQQANGGKSTLAETLRAS